MRKTFELFKTIIAFAIFALLLVISHPVFAQTVPATVTVAWSAPTLAVDGTALTGVQSVTSYQVWIDTVSIPDVVATPPLVTLTAAQTTVTQTLSGPAGGSLFARVKACNAAGCGVFSAQASKPIPPLAKPNPPTNVTVTLTISP